MIFISVVYTANYVIFYLEPSKVFRVNEVFSFNHKRIKIQPITSRTEANTEIKETRDQVENLFELALH